MSGFSGGGVTRELLTAARTYYVRTDGSDSNTGLVNSAGGAFLTIAKAMTVAGAIDCGSQQLTISVQAGTYTAAISLPRVLYGGAIPILTGVGATTILNTTSADAITNDGGTPWSVQSLKMQTTTGGSCMVAVNAGVIKHSGVEFGASASIHMLASPLSAIKATGNYAVSGGAQYHMASNGSIDINGQTLTITGTPAFSGAFALASRAGTVIAFNNTFTSSATGVRYSAVGNGVIDTAGGGATYFPGGTAGSVATGGQYL